MCQVGGVQSTACSQQKVMSNRRNYQEHLVERRKFAGTAREVAIVPFAALHQYPSKPGLYMLRYIR